MELQDSFDIFLKRIALDGLPEGRVLSAWNELRPFLIRALQVPESDVFLHGSYANGTAVVPPSSGGEYDVDVCVICSKAGDTVAQAFRRLESVLESDGRYANRLERKNPCVRLRYARDEEGRFHVDIVAARPYREMLEIPHRDDGWKPTNPRGYTTWCLARGERFQRIVRILKRWRDVNQDDRRCIKSIVLQVLAANALAVGEMGDARALVATLDGIQRTLAPWVNAVPVVMNPSVPGQNLTESWPLGHYQHFRRELDQAVDLARRALEASDPPTSAKLWRDLLGDDFPLSGGGSGGTPPPPPPPPGRRRPLQDAPPPERYG